MSNIINIQQIIAKEVSLSEARKMVILHKGELFTFFDEGTSRFVFSNDDDTKVIKILKNDSTNFNTEEVRIYTEANEEDKIRMVETTIFNGIIEQEFCTPIKFGGRKLNAEQNEFANRCRREVGWDKDGNLVCFDLDEFLKY